MAKMERPEQKGTLIPKTAPAKLSTKASNELRVTNTYRAIICIDILPVVHITSSEIINMFMGLEFGRELTGETLPLIAIYKNTCLSLKPMRRILLIMAYLATKQTIMLLNTAIASTKLQNKGRLIIKYFWPSNLVTRFSKPSWLLTCNNMSDD